MFKRKKESIYKALWDLTRIGIKVNSSVNRAVA